MRVISWNINSVRLRLPLAQRLLQETDADVLCLQETKALPDQFPTEGFNEIGFTHQVVRGMKAYNGVAIVSRVPIEETNSRDFCGREDARHVAVSVDGQFELHNFYVPAGGDIPDRDENEKFDHKLNFLDEMTDWLSSMSSDKPMMMLGDLNIAPLETDVWSHKQLLKVVSHTPIEVEALDKVQASLDWRDAVREVIPPEETLFSWWSYRSKDWRASNRGRRLDHIWVTPGFKSEITGASVYDQARDWEKCSDHAPVVLDF